MNSGVMLNAYPDSMGGTLDNIVELLMRPEFKDVFQSFYILPSIFNSDLDRGFSVISYDLNRQLASSNSIAQLSELGIDLKLDFILNHLSVLSPQFQDILKHGDESIYRDFFIDWNKFWAGYGEMTQDGYIQPKPEHISNMFFRKPGLPILSVRFPDGKNIPYWNTFYQEVTYDKIDAQDILRTINVQYCQAIDLSARINAAIEQDKKPSEINFDGYEVYRTNCIELLQKRRKYLGQMDLNLSSPLVWDYYDNVLKTLANYGANIVRLDAFAYAPKAPGLRNFMNEPDTWDTLQSIKKLAEKYNLLLLPEIHTSYEEKSYLTLSSKGYLTYDFFLPGLIIDAIENHDSSYLKCWAEELLERKIRTVNMLGCHDGIPLLDLKGLIPEERIQNLIDLIISRGGLIKNLHGQKNVYYQVNATYFSALGANEQKLLLARALQLFMPGKPQIWYLDLFAGKNDLNAVKRSGAAGHKEINRTNLTNQEIEHALKKRVVLDQLKLLRMRNICPALDFDSVLTLTASEHEIVFSWKKGAATAKLHANLETYSFKVTADTLEGLFQYDAGSDF